jgi:LytR cell envelope-related transcriptional attenuator
VVTGGDAQDFERVLYRKRKPIPAIVIIALLGLAVVVVWTKVINKASDVTTVVACAPSSAQPVVPAGQPKPQPGTPLSYDALDKIAPEPATDIRVQVYNASTERGAATAASSQLSQAGFQVADPTNDPMYPNQDMSCRGQIRFGANGESAARTISLLVPCTQLVRDNRQDNTVSLAIGKNFAGVTPNAQAQQALGQLSTWAASHPAPQGGQQALNSVLPQLNPGLLAQAHPDQC